MNRRLSLFILGAIFLLGLFFRLYKIDQSPPSLNWDEAAAAYNAYTIWNWGKDEWGKTMPLVFTSFRDDKHPVHIYLTAPFVGLFGNNMVSARASGVLVSSLSVLVIYFLAAEMFKNKIAGIMASVFLLFSPYHIFFGRGLWEINFALFFFLLGLWLFYKGLISGKHLPYSFLSFGVSLYSYHSSKIVVFPLVLLLIVLYLKQLLKIKKYFIAGVGIYAIFIIGMVLQPKLLGLARVNQTKFTNEEIENTYIWKKTRNNLLASVEIALKHYPDYFSYEYLFESGDQNPRNSVKVFGEFYKTDIVFFAIGVVSLLFVNWKIGLFLIAWLVLSPFPSAISSSTPNAVRAVFMLGVTQLLAAGGVVGVLKLLKKDIYAYLYIVIIFLLTSFQFLPYFKYLLNEYPKKEAIEWQYGMKEIVEYVKDNPEYKRVFMDNVRSQPYIFFLYYLGIPQPELAKTVKYDQTIENTHNTIESFGKYQFGNWDWVGSLPSYDYLYILEPYKYTGLFYQKDFTIQKLVKYPNERDAFFIISVNTK